MKGFPALAAGGTDEHDVSGGGGDAGLGFHLRDSMFHQAKDGVEVDRESRAPLLVGHFVDGYILRGPDAVIGDEDVEASEMLDCRSDENAGGVWAVQVARDRVAVGGAAFLDQGFSLRTRVLI